MENIEIDLLFYPSNAKVYFINMVLPCNNIITCLYLVNMIKAERITSLPSIFIKSKLDHLEKYVISLSISFLIIAQIEKYENTKYIPQLKHYCYIEKRKLNNQLLIFVNERNVMETEKEAEDFISINPVRIVAIRKEIIFMIMNRAE